MNKPLYLIPILSFTLHLGCDDTASGIQKDTREALNNAAEGAQEVAKKVERATEHADDELDAFREQRREDIDALEEKIDQLDERARNASADVQAQAVNQAQEFEQRRSALKAQLEQLGDAAGSQWAQAKARVSEGIVALDRDVDQALNRLSPTSARPLDVE